MYRVIAWKNPQPPEERDAEVWINPRYVISIHKYTPSNPAQGPVSQIIMSNGNSYHVLGLVEQHGAGMRAMLYHMNKAVD